MASIALEGNARRRAGLLRSWLIAEVCGVCVMASAHWTRLGRRHGTFGGKRIPGFSSIANLSRS